MPSIAGYIDHTLLNPRALPRDVERLCAEAVRFGFKAVCVHAFHVAQAAALLSGHAALPVCVAGFPLGATLSRVKAFEAEAAVREGAREIDMVLNLGAFAAGEYDLVREDVSEVVRAIPEIPVKVIIETGYLSDEEKRLACALCAEAGAAFVKTSTGFGPGGATTADVRLMRAAVGPGMGVKASGGIRDLATARTMLEAGADRIGTSSSVAIALAELEEAGERT
ncbi:MAG: deoxyribose-phosphate aldolase [Desulfovibrio sp.]